MSCIHAYWFCLFYWDILKEHLKSVTLQSKIPAAFSKSAESFVCEKKYRSRKKAGTCGRWFINKSWGWVWGKEVAVKGTGSGYR